jgi:hypothetical protein
MMILPLGAQFIESSTLIGSDRHRHRHSARAALPGQGDPRTLELDYCTGTLILVHKCEKMYDDV